jgi:hypothetical protein
MDSYFVVFNAHIDELRRPENFPHVVKIKDVYNDVENIPHLQFLVNDRFTKLVISAGLVVMKNEDEPVEEGKITFDKRVFVPWHMITHMTLDVHHMPAKQVRPQDSIVPTSNTPTEPTKELVN